MSISTDLLAKPGTWTRIDPVSGQTAPGLNLNGSALDHGDLTAIAGSNPSIIRDEQNSLWHMVWAQWGGGGLAYTKSTDLYRWDTPNFVLESDNQTPDLIYPTLVGDEGDTLATDGTATMYFTASNTISFGRPLWSVGLGFGTSGNATNTSVSSASTQSSKSGQTVSSGPYSNSTQAINPICSTTSCRSGTPSATGAAAKKKAKAFHHGQRGSSHPHHHEYYKSQ